MQSLPEPIAARLRKQIQNMKATVIIPTFDHGALITFAIQSVLMQTFSSFELFVIGDGAPEETKTLVRSFENQDDRVRFFDHEKGARNGEVYRHAALQEASGDFVAYLSDDDLYLPNHLEVLAKALTHYEFVNVRTFDIRADGSIWPFPVDLARTFYRYLFDCGHNRIPLSMAGHTMELYRRLPFGWRTTPRPIFTDLYMWQQILGSTESIASLPDISVLHFSSPERKGFTQETRYQELSEYFEQLSNKEDCQRLVANIDFSLSQSAVEIDEHYFNFLQSKDAEIESLKVQLHNGLTDAQAHFAALERHFSAVTSPPRLGRLGRILRQFGLATMETDKPN
jgi:GalNAc5-diNAcBac-PP-undecaprenol beta-1,3-glucosyltransferase